MTLTLKNETLEDIKNHTNYLSLTADDLVSILTDKQAIALSSKILFEVRQRKQEKEEQMIKDLEKETIINAKPN